MGCPSLSPYRNGEVANRAGDVWTEAEVKMREYLAKAIQEERENTEPSARLTEPSATNPICEKTYFGS